MSGWVSSGRTVGFGLPGGLRLDVPSALRLVNLAAERGLGPVLLTEVSGFDAIALSTAFAAQHPDCPTGTGIVPLGSKTLPAIAMGARTAGELSDAPYLLGVGVSTRQIVSGWHGADYDPTVATTVQRLRDLKALLQGDRRGSFALTSTGVADVRVLLGAMGPRMVRAGLEEADGVVINHTPADRLPQAPDGKLLLAYVWVLACEDGDTRVRRDLTSYVMADPYARHFTELGFGDTVAEVRAMHAAGRLREAPARLPVEMVDTFSVTPDRLPARVTEFQDAGAVPVLMPVTGERPGEEISGLLESSCWTSEPALR
jgi:hypothetical protein